VAENYGLHHLTAVRLQALQRWIKEMSK
jgi:hypothetical protein